MIPVYALNPKVTPDYLGMIPMWLSEEDPRPAKEQLNDNYQHGGGWDPFKGFVLREDNSLKYPGDPVMKPFALMKVRDETVLMYPCAWVAIIQPDRSFEVCRMD